MGKKRDLTGFRSGRLVAICEAGKNKHGKILWKCKCDCGKEITTIGSDLYRGHTTSCGCSRSTHKMRDHRLYSIWSSMKNRCSCKNNTQYEYYGGIGISVCDEWMKFEPFFDWAMNNGYKDDLTLDRINPNKNYQPSNCRWADKATQARNTKLDKRSTTGVKGVSFDKRTQKYHASICVNSKRKSLGYHKTLEEAKLARQEGERIYWGVQP